MTKTLRFAAAVLLVLTACSSGSGVKTTLDEYSIAVAKRTLPSGSQTFDVTNAGTIAHQFLVLRTDRRPDDLPTKDGVVNTDAKGVKIAGELEIVSPGASDHLVVNLRPGRYTLICNIAGHYTNGMRTGLSID